MVKNIKKILIFNNEKPFARNLAIKLTHAGFKTETVFNGEDGIKLLEKESFSLILLDLIMPKMDGLMALAILKVKKIKTPVIILADLNQESDINHAKELGAKDFFIKSNTTIENMVLQITELLK